MCHGLKLLLSKYGTLMLVSKGANPLTFKIQIRLHRAIYFLPSPAKAIKGLHGDIVLNRSAFILISGRVWCPSCPRLWWVWIRP
jgi:hypothetical protein